MFNFKEREKMFEATLYSTGVINGYELTFTKMKITFRKK